MRGQCNIYSDITFHFYEAGKSCRSRKRAARDIPAWEATVTENSTQRDGSEQAGVQRAVNTARHSTSTSGQGRMGAGAGSSCSRPHRGHSTGPARRALPAITLPLKMI